MAKSRKVLSLMLAALMVVTLLPVSALADGPEVPEAVSLSTVLGQPVAVTESSVEGSTYHISADVTVYYLDETISAGDIVAADTSAAVTFYGEDNTYTTAETEPVSLTPDGSKSVYVKVEAAENTALYTLAISATALREIASFDPIEIDAGTAGAATYADAEAVIAALPTTVTISDTSVTVTVTGWAETDTYDPATAGSYTFTATLGDIPGGYELGSGVTATAKAVVAEALDPAVSPAAGWTDPAGNELASISGDQEFTFSFESVTGALTELELDIYLLDEGETHDYSNHVGINLPAGASAVEALVAETADNFTSTSREDLVAAKSEDFVKVFEAAGFVAGGANDLELLKSRIKYIHASDTWTITLDTETLASEEIEFLVTVRDDAGARWGINDYTDPSYDGSNAFRYAITAPPW